MQTLSLQDSFAQTYKPPTHIDPCEAIDEFRYFQRMYANSEMGSTAVARRMEVPRGRVRAWMNGSKPDVVRGVDIAKANGWLEFEFDNDTFERLNRLVAGIFSGGSISDSTYVPSFSVPDHKVETQLRDDLETLGAGCRLVMSNSGAVEEYRPTNDASVLGRILVSLGAPQGTKAETVDSLPAYLDWTPQEVCYEFVRVYVANRGVRVDNKEFVQITEQRSSQYLNSVAALIRSVTDVDIWRGKNSIRFGDAALSTLELAE